MQLVIAQFLQLLWFGVVPALCCSGLSKWQFCPALPCPAPPRPARPCSALPCPYLPCPALPCSTWHVLPGCAVLKSCAKACTPSQSYLVLSLPNLVLIWSKPYPIWSYLVLFLPNLVLTLPNPSKPGPYLTQPGPNPTLPGPNPAQPGPSSGPALSHLIVTSFCTCRSYLVQYQLRRLCGRH